VTVFIVDESGGSQNMGASTSRNEFGLKQFFFLFLIITEIQKKKPFVIFDEQITQQNLWILFRFCGGPGRHPRLFAFETDPPKLPHNDNASTVMYRAHQFKRDIKIWELHSRPSMNLKSLLKYNLRTSEKSLFFHRGICSNNKRYWYEGIICEVKHMD
jgi:hypothetical protein